MKSNWDENKYYLNCSVCVNKSTNKSITPEDIDYRNKLEIKKGKFYLSCCESKSHVEFERITKKIKKKDE